MKKNVMLTPLVALVHRTPLVHLDGEDGDDFLAANDGQWRVAA